MTLISESSSVTPCLVARYISFYSLHATKLYGANRDKTNEDAKKGWRGLSAWRGKVVGEHWGKLLPWLESKARSVRREGTTRGEGIEYNGGTHPLRTWPQ